MLSAKVVAIVHTARTLEGAQLVRWVCLDSGLEAADLVGCSPGDTVLVCRGSMADRMVPQCPADAAVVAILEEVEKKVDKPGEKQL